ncbi:SRPBCC family protein [Tropicibacter sp. Alg240-R139]|uniref:SRPBCC family protein n=1 Tax=Tropicibacter sp. Alg240-R139 TaxID=2305991 RepID=UPI0013E04A0A|nr:SRPBCC family protein [Tropicibacter sp. Alg240-R139]
MKLIKRILWAFVIGVIALAAVSYLLPGQAVVTRSVTIDAPAKDVFPHVNSMQATEAWSPWLLRDPETKLSYSGPEAGVGNTLSWMSDHPQVGSGTQEIVESVENQLVRTELDFGSMGTATATFNLRPDGSGTNVTWGFQSELGMNPLSRWMGLMMDDWVGGDYETGLANLKVLVEKSG